ncbi:MAG TPA: hypothetical protein VGE72_03760 [Azospirillum sp.]
MKTSFLFALTALLAAMFGSPEDASAQTSQRIDHCRQPAPRSTFVYIDITSAGVQNGQWLAPLLTNVAFLPREPVYVIWFNPTNGEGKQLFFDCFPGITVEEEQALARDPATQFRALFVGAAAQVWQRDQRRFITDLAQGADVLARAAAGRTSSSANKAVAEFLARERRRFNESAGVPRIIIYSDMAQNSSFASPLSNRNPQDEAEQAVRRIANHFGYAEVHVYGTEPGLGGPMRPGEREGALAAFWRAYFQKTNAQLKSFDRELALRRTSPETIQEPAKLFTGEGGIAHLSGSDQNRYAPARMQMLVNAQGTVENAWLDFPNLGAVPFTGTLRCANTVECTFVGQIDGDLGGFLLRGDGFEFSTAGTRVQGQIRLPGVDLLKVGERSGVAPPAYDIAFVQTGERLR